MGIEDLRPPMARPVLMSAVANGDVDIVYVMLADGKLFRVFPDGMGNNSSCPMWQHLGGVGDAFSTIAEKS